MRAAGRVEAVKSTDRFVLCTHARAAGVHYYTVLIFFRARALLIKESLGSILPAPFLLLHLQMYVRIHESIRVFYLVFERVRAHRTHACTRLL
jgi:hypothetical protein